MINEYKAFFEAFKIGKQLTNSATWKNRTLTTNLISGLVVSVTVIAQGAGYYISIDPEQLSQLIGGGYAALGVFNAIMTCVTSSKVGIK
jgi:hypothetical protein